MHADIDLAGIRSGQLARRPMNPSQLCFACALRLQMSCKWSYKPASAYSTCVSRVFTGLFNMPFVTVIVSRTEPDKRRMAPASAASLSVNPHAPEETNTYTTDKLLGNMHGCCRWRRFVMLSRISF